MFELYNPSPNFEEKLYYEFGECYEIENPGTDNRFHRGSEQDQTALLPATGTFNTGDAWFRTRTIPIEGGEISINIHSLDS